MGIIEEIDKQMEIARSQYTESKNVGDENYFLGSFLTLQWVRNAVLKEQDVAELEKKIRKQKLQLLAEKTTLDRMISYLPESSVIDRMSLEARRETVMKHLEEFDY